MRKNFTLLLAVLCSLQLSAQRLLTEDFNYIAGTLTSNNGGANVSGGSWVGFSGTGFNIEVVNGSLSYSGYGTAPTGDSRKIALVSASSSAEDAYREFTPQTANTVYASFLLNVDSTGNLYADTSSRGEYFASLLPSTSTSNYVARVVIRKGSAANSFNLGILAQSTSGITAGWSSSDYVPGTTYLVTLAYQFIVGANNDIAKIWVNAANSATEPAAAATSVFSAGTEPSDIGRIAFRQASNNTPSCDVDAIKVSTNWADGTLPVKLSSFSAALVNGIANISWTTENELNMKAFVVEKSNNAVTYTTVNSVAAKNGGKPNTYKLTNVQALSGNTWYRLKMVDMDGTVTYSDAKMLSAKQLAALALKGNVVSSTVIVSHKQALAGSSLQVVSSTGAVVLKKQLVQGTNETTLNVASLPAGNYFVVYTNGKDKESVKFVKY